VGDRPPGWLTVEAALDRGGAGRPVDGRNCTRGAAPTLTSPPARKPLRRTWSVARRRPLGLGARRVPPCATQVGAPALRRVGRAGRRWPANTAHAPRRPRSRRGWGAAATSATRLPSAPVANARGWDEAWGFSPLLAGRRKGAAGRSENSGHGGGHPKWHHRGAGDPPSGRASPARPPDHPPAHCLWRECWTDVPDKGDRPPRRPPGRHRRGRQLPFRGAPPDWDAARRAAVPAVTCPHTADQVGDCRRTA